MKVKERQSKITAIIREKESISVEELAASLNISRETIRRDLTDLANANKIRKVHGGATLPHSFGESSFQQRMLENAEAKASVAKTAAKLFAQGETLFVDTGSTTLYFAEKLSEVSGLTIVTNSTSIAKTISEHAADHQVFLLGGEYSSDNAQTVGTMVTAQISSFRAHHAVLAIGALDGRSGAMDFNIEEAQIARAMLEQARSVTVLMDSSKFNQLASFEVCPLSRIDRLVCDSQPPAALGEALEKAGVQVIVAS